jgi:CDP-2,3-bis-(O-geranylgeranyl)-sn-glycerol synthase
MEYILTTLWIFLPALFANMFAAVSRHIPYTDFLAKPVDFGKKIKNHRIFGDGKTFRGFIFGILASIILVYSQQNLSELQLIQNFLTVSYTDFSTFAWGLGIGFGALMGDTIESFFKRRLNVGRGESFFPFDQIDFAIGAALFSLFYRQLDILYYLILIPLFFIIHLIGKYIGFKLKIDDKPI